MTSGYQAIRTEVPGGYDATSSMSDWHNATEEVVVEFNASKIFKEWIFCEIVTILLVIVLVYVITSLTIFQLRKSGYCKRNDEKANHKARRNDVRLTGLTLTATVFTLIRCFLDVDTIFGRFSEISCTYLKKPKIAIAFIALFFGILTYWVRQRMFYGSSHMKHIVNKVTKFVSIGIFPALGAIFLAGLLYFMIQDVGYMPLPPYGCSESTNIIPFLLVALTIFLSQVTLVLLLVYPILKRRRNSSIRASIKAKQNKKQGKLMRLVRKAFLTALVAVISNALALAIIAIVPTQVDDIGMVIVDINLTILVFCLVFSSADSKRRLRPWLALKESALAPSSFSNSSTHAKVTLHNCPGNGPTQSTPLTPHVCKAEYSAQSSNASETTTPTKTRSS